jgi:beta-1,4-mannosyl-glycoprotein beta-1,4-N-acetylglucosaminyltransferase
MIYEFIYLHNEIDLLLPKLWESKDAVDKFILIESPTDLLHRAKPLYYKENIDRFSDFNHKITHVVPQDSSLQKIGYSLFRERLAHVAEGLINSKPNDIVIITDPDVILKSSIYSKIEKLDLSENEGIVETRWFCYYMDYRYIVRNHPFTNVYLRKNTIDSEWEFIHRWKPALDPIKDGGWHLSKLGGVDALITNISGYPHLELDTEERKNKEILTKKIEEGIAWDDAYPGTVVFKAVPYNPQDYPKYIVEHPEVYAKYFKGGMNAYY